MAGVIYQNIKERVPDVKPGLPKPEEGRAYVLPGDAAFPEVGLSIGSVIKHRGSDLVLKLSPVQVGKLLLPVTTPLGDLYDSPNSEQQAYPVEWKLFINQLHEIAWWKHNNFTIGNIIKAMRGYHWQNGWLKFRPQPFIDSTDTLEEHGL